jgi:uncharacterized repeat protein (TIGR03943 family)
VSREARALILTAMALLLLRLSLTGQHVLFVKPSMGPFLLVAGGVVAVLAACAMFEPESEHDHDDHHGAHRLAWLLMVPFVVVFVIGPAPLGSFMVTRQPHRVTAEPGSGAQYRLPAPVDGAVELTVNEINQHGLYDVDQHMTGARLRVDGFVVPDTDGPKGTFLLTRFVLSCCAADAYPVSLRISGIRHLPQKDTWVRIEGTWKAHPMQDVREFESIEADQLVLIPAPADPYLPA